MKRLEALYGKMIVARDEFVYKSEGGLVIPDTAKSKTTVGKIIGMGPNVVGFEVGEKVLFTRLSGIVFTVIDRTHPRAHANTGEVEFVILDQTEVYCKIKEVGEPQTSQVEDDRIID
jgi:co-chaperonin GroES (HSP10)